MAEVKQMNQQKDQKISDKEIIKQLEEQNQYIVQEYQKMRDYVSKVKLEEMSLSLTSLFEVLKSKDLFPKEFVDTCVAKIQEIMTPTKE